jgi:hypothetical protein
LLGGMDQLDPEQEGWLRDAAEFASRRLEAACPGASSAEGVVATESGFRSVQASSS